MSTTRAVWLFVLALTGIRLALIGTADLSFDEAHYWMWSQRLAPAYFSKGPGVAFAIWSSTAIFGATDFGVRFWSPVLGAGTSLLLYYFARRLFNATTGFWVVLILNVTPIFNLGTFVMTIDPLSIFFWVAALYTFWLALERHPQFSWYWPLTGLLIGLGFLCKYTNALELVSVLVVLALIPRFRREFRQPGLYTLLATFAVCTIPPIVWMQQHAWATLGHLRSSGRLDHAPRFSPVEFLSFLGGHFVVYSPLIFLGLVWAVIANWRRWHHQFKGIFLLWFGLPVFAIYALLSINKAANANWDALAFPSLAVLACAFWSERMEARPLLRRLALLAVLIAVPMSMVTLNTDLLRLVGFQFPKNDPADRIRGWRSAADAVEQVRREVEQKLNERVFVIADGRDRASELSFYFRDKRREGPGHPEVYLIESQDIQNQFSFWPRYDEFVAAPTPSTPGEGDVYSEENGLNPFVGRTALYVQQSSARETPRNIQQAFQSTELVATIEVRRGGRLIRAFNAFLCKSYRSLPL
ncbi:MAG: glycosyltransferase family 39 protein [Chthoniobacterales bacterium]